MHYRRFISNCPIPIAFDGCKTTALRCSLALLGTHTTWFFREKSKIIPLGIDFPDWIALSNNGAQTGTVKYNQHQLL